MAEDGDELFLPEILHGLRGDFVRAVPLIDIVDILIVLCDLLENELEELPVENGAITVPVKNFEIVTVKIR